MARVLASSRPVRFTAIAVSSALLLTTAATTAAQAASAAGSPSDAGPPAASAPAAQSAPDRPAAGRHAVLADGEIPDLRTATSRTYRVGKGRVQARIADHAVNHRDANGDWQRNDNTLTTDAKGHRHNKANGYTLDLPRDLSDGPVTVGVGGARAGFQLAGAAGTATISGDTATYANALPGVDVSYQAQDAAVKEVLTLTSAGTATSFDFSTQLSSGITLTSTPDGGMAARSSRGLELQYAAPNVEDSSGQPAGYSTTAVTMTLSGPDTGPTVHLAVDPAWLNDPARVFPVRIDPSYTATVTGQTYVNSGASTTNYSTATVLRVGKDSAGASNNSLIRFDTSGIPRDDTVALATLNLDVNSNDANANNTTVQVKPITRAWTQTGASWSKYDGTNAWTTPGGDVGAASASATFLTGDWSTSFDLTKLAADWVSGAVVNNGAQLSSTATANSSRIAFGKSSFSPSLDITYDTRTGDEAFYTYTSQQLTDRATLKVNVGSGNLLLANNDLSASAPGLPLRVGRFYNSRTLTAGSAAFPTGWTQTGNDDYFQAGLQPAPISTADGAVHEFTMNLNDFSYTRPAGIKADLTAPGDGSGQLIARGSRLTQNFDVDGHLASVKDRNGNTITYSYQTPASPLSWLASITDTAGRSTTFSYGARENSFTDPGGRIVSFGYDANSNYLTSFTDAAGKITTYGYNTAGLLSQIVDPLGHKTTMTYDTAGRATGITRVTNTSTGTGPTTTYAYTATGSGNGQTVVTDPNGHAITYAYDKLGRVTKVTDALGHARSNTYGTDNNATTAVDALTPGNTTTFGFDSDFRSTTATAPTGGIASLRYGEVSGTVTNPVSHWQPSGTTSPDGNASTFSYDGPGNLTKSQDTTSGPTGGVANSYTYNPPAPAVMVCGGKPGQVCTSTDGNGKVTTYHYTTVGNLDLVTPPATVPASLGTTAYTYDSLARVATMTDGKGQVTRYTYDNLDRVTQTRFNGTTTCTSTDISNGLCITTGYDDDGNKTSSVDQTGTSTWTYDPLNRESARSMPSTGTTSLTYDNVGNVLTAVDASGTITYTYDNANELITLLEPGGSCTATPKDRCTTFGYDNNGKRITTTYPTGSTPTVMTAIYDNSGRVKQIKAQVGTATPLPSDLSYTYSRTVGTTATDGELTRTRVDNTATGTAGKTTTYGYDTLSRLTSAVEKDTLGTTTTASWSYGYDNAGNRTSATLSPQGTGGTTTFTYNSTNEILTRAGTSTGWAYDANGAETAAVGATTRAAGAWNPKGQNTTATVAGIAQPRTYSGTGNKLRLTSDSIGFRNTALGVTGQTVGSSTDNFVRDPSGTLVALRTAAGASYYYVFDGLGSVVALISSAGVKSNSYSYDPYGQARAKTEAVANPWQYTGGYLDAATGLYKLGIRYYDPTLGRFTQPDPTGQDPHYVYARNNPVSFTDPSGAGLLTTLVESFFNGADAGQIITDILRGEISHDLLVDMLSILTSDIIFAVCEGLLAAGSVPTAGGALAVGTVGCITLSEAIGVIVAAQF
jgi:RHS repeat-associated protein